MNPKQYKEVGGKKSLSKETLRALLFVCEQEIVTHEDFGRILTRDKPEREPLTRRAIDLRIAPLQEMGLVERRHINYKTYIHPTKAGYEYAGCSLPRTMPTS